MSSTAQPVAAPVAARDQTELAWEALLRTAEGFSLELAKKVAIKMVSEPNKLLRTNTCSLIAMSVATNKDAFKRALAMFPLTPFKTQFEQLMNDATGGSEMNYSAVNAVGWLVFSSGVELRPGFRQAIQKKAGASSWADATFSGFSDKPKVAGQLSGRQVATERRNAYGVDPIRVAISEVVAAVSKS